MLSKGSIVETYEYSPYGDILDGDSGLTLFLYNGKYGVASDNNGLYYMRARYYDISIKRFVNQDVVIGHLDATSSLNRYAYCEGNPVSYLDPFGLWREDTEELHDIANKVSLVGTVIIFLGAPEIGGAMVLLATCFDMGLCIYDMIDDAAEGRGFYLVLKDFGLALLDLASLFTGGILKAAKMNLAVSEFHILESIEKDLIKIEKYLRNDLKKAKRIDKIANYANIIGNKIANFSFSDFKQKVKEKLNDGKGEFVKKIKEYF